MIVPSGGETYRVGPEDRDVRVSGRPVLLTAVEGPSAASLFEEHFASLCRTAFLILGNSYAAEEVVMETFARTLPRWHAVQGAEHPVGYLRRAVVNLSISRVRRRVLEHRAARSVGFADGGAWDADLDGRAREVIRAIGELPPRQRACIVLRYFDDLSEQDVANTLGCSVGTVKSQVAKAKARLAVLLAPLKEER